MKKQNHSETILYPGAKIKCITAMSEGEINACMSIGYSIPLKGKTYTVRGLSYSSGAKQNMVLLEEIKNPNLYEGYEFGYFIPYFKLIGAKKRVKQSIGCRPTNIPCPSSDIN